MLPAFLIRPSRGKGVLHAELQVLGGDDVAHIDGLVQAAAEDDLAPRLHAGPGDVPGRGRASSWASTSAWTARASASLSVTQHRAGQPVVLGLAEQVGGHPGGSAAAVSQDQDLAGAGDHVDAHLAVDLALGGGHIDVAGAHDLVHRRHALGAIGQGRHRLRPAGLEDAGDAGHRRRRQDGGGHPAVPAGGGDHDDLGHPRPPGRG